MHNFRNKVIRGGMIIVEVERALTLNIDAHHRQLASVPEVPEVRSLPRPDAVPFAAKEIL